MSRTPREPIPVTTNRLSRMEGLLIEIVHQQDVLLKRITTLQIALEPMTEVAGVVGSGNVTTDLLIPDSSLRKQAARRSRRHRP